MIATFNLERILKECSGCEKIVDIGGGRHVFPHATHVVDLNPFDSNVRLDPIFESEAKFTEDTWLVLDVCKDKIPVEDKFFDYCFCSHLLEDIKDPMFVCAEMIRVAKKGYIEVPSRVREIFSKARFFNFKAMTGNIPEVGFHHHRWFVDVDDNKISFSQKDYRLINNRKNYITRGELGRKLTAKESSAYLFWDNSFEYEEVVFYEEEELGKFKKQALLELKNS